MPSSIRELAATLPVFDVHEHHLPELFLSPEVGLLDLFRQSYAGWTRERPYPLEGEERSSDPMLVSSPEPSWDDLAPYLEASGASFFVRNLVRAIEELYGEAPSAKNFVDLDREIRRRHREPAWAHEILDRANIHRVITDAYTDPLLDARSSLGGRHRSVLRINCLALGWHPSSCDHNGNSAEELASRFRATLDDFDSYRAFLELLVGSLRDRGQLGLKNALAYDRDVSFDEPDERAAREAFGESHPSAARRKAFGDWVVDTLCRLAGERGVPVQMHLGTARIRGSRPLLAAGLVERHPNTRFLLMHLGYPWSAELLGLAFVYRNVWIDLTWSFLLSPTRFRHALHEAIEVLPDDSRLMLGGDNWHAEETFGSIQTARRLIGQVLDEKLEDGYFGRPEAERLVRRILAENAEAFFGPN